jgi:hypothetical protein
MPRDRLVEPVSPPVVPVIQPTAVYTVATFQRTFGLRPSSLRREVREGRLKVQKRCGRYFILGSAVLDWLKGQ